MCSRDWRRVPPSAAAQLPPSACARPPTQRPSRCTRPYSQSIRQLFKVRIFGQFRMSEYRRQRLPEDQRPSCDRFEISRLRSAVIGAAFFGHAATARENWEQKVVPESGAVQLVPFPLPLASVIEPCIVSIPSKNPSDSVNSNVLPSLVV